MKWRERDAVTIWAVALLAAATGCGRSGAAHKPDGSSDAAVEALDAAASGDAAAEAAPDVAPDASFDDASDASADVSVSSDAASGSASDASADVATDAVLEASADVVVEAPPAFDAGVDCVGPGVETPLVPGDSGLPAAGLVLWVRADRGIYKTAQNAVCAWRDQSGHGNDLHPATARPTWEDAAVGGKPAVHSAAVGQEMAIAGALGIGGTSGRTFIAVTQLVTANGRFHPIIQGEAGTPGTYFAIDANTWMTAGSREGAYLSTNSFDTTLATSTSPRLHVLSVSTMTPGTSIATALGYRVDGQVQTLTVKVGLSGGVIQSFASANFTSVGVVSGTPSAGVAGGNGRVAEVIAYDRPLATNEIVAVEAALKARYGIP